MLSRLHKLVLWTNFAVTCPVMSRAAGSLLDLLPLTL